MVGAKLCIPVAHLEAGLRSRDRTMPEEINRLVTDAISDVLWTPSPDGDENLLAEGVPPSRISRVGNIMIDCFELVRPAIEAADVRRRARARARRLRRRHAAPAVQRRRSGAARSGWSTR